MKSRAELTKLEVIDMLRHWMKQRAGLDIRDYGYARNAHELEMVRKSYMQESRRITQQRKDAETMLTSIQFSSITADELKESFRAYSGRLELSEDGKLSYCTGQYFPTEYRAVVCAIASYALWDYYRKQPGVDTGDDIRKLARKEFGRGIASRWFN